MFKAVPADVLALGLDRVRYATVPVLLFLGGVTADFTPLSVFLSLHVSDVLLIAAGVLALPPPDNLLRRALAFFRANRAFAVVALLGALFLIGTG